MIDSNNTNVIPSSSIMLLTSLSAYITATLNPNASGIFFEYVLRSMDVMWHSYSGFQITLTYSN